MSKYMQIYAFFQKKNGKLFLNRWMNTQSNILKVAWLDIPQTKAADLVNLWLKGIINKDKIKYASKHFHRV